MKIIKKNIRSKNKVIVVDEEDSEEFRHLPTTKVECPKCGNRLAHWFMRQMRAGDEPPTIFYTCAKCKHKWRSYG